MSYTIDYANKEDLDSLVAMAKAFHSESLYSKMSFDEDKVHDTALKMLGQSDEATILVLCYNGQPVGAVAGMIRQMLFSSDPMAIEIMYYIQPEHRARKAALQLVRAFELWARSKKCPLAYFGSYPDHPFQRFLEKEEWTRTEGSYTKWLR